MSTQCSSESSNKLDLNALVKAIKVCLVEKKPTKSTAKAFSIPRSTLQRYKKKVEDNFNDLEAIDDDELLAFVRGCHERVPTNQVFSMEQENALVQYIFKCAKHYYGLNVTELRELAYEYAVKLEVPFPSKWHEEKKAGFEWYRKFRRRHPQLVLRTPEQSRTLARCVLVKQSPASEDDAE